jgi:protein-S-isoprenylcysteine O-methyltransferase Ste14
MEPQPEAPSPLAAARINRALGLFLLFFAAVVFVAVFFTETTVGQWTNAVVALLLAAIGGGMVWAARERG